MGTRMSQIGAKHILMAKEEIYLRQGPGTGKALFFFFLKDEHHLSYRDLGFQCEKTLREVNLLVILLADHLNNETHYYFRWYLVL